MGKKNNYEIINIKKVSKKEELSSTRSPCLLSVFPRHSFNNLADVDECSSNPCQEDEICVDGWESFVCLSQPTEDTDECLDSPCPENATCINTPGSYQCLQPSTSPDNKICRSVFGSNFL